MERWKQLREATGIDEKDFPEIPKSMEPILCALLQRWEEEKDRKSQVEDTLAFFKASANAMPNPIFIKDENLRFVFFNQAYRDFFGLEEGENIGKRVQDLHYLPKDARKRYQEEDMKMLNSLTATTYETEFETESQGKIESLYWSKGFEISETGGRGLVGEIVDISREKEMQKELAKNVRILEVLMKDAKGASNLDPLTKLYNRNILEEEVPLIMQEAESRNRNICMMLIDVDYFKQINDTYGHLCGDEILQNLAELMRHTFRQQDVAIRYGGDEFMLLLPGAEQEQACKGAERLRDLVHAQLKLPDDKKVTLSIGVAQWKKGDDMPAFIARTDGALYEAKRAGRDRVACHSSDDSAR